MSSTGASVRKHPAKEEITERLLHGESPESVAQWLRQKYTRDKRMWFDKMTLQAYRKNFLNLDGEVLADIKKERKERVKEEKEKHAVQVVQATDAYQLAKVEAAEQYVLQISDTRNRLEELYLKVMERIAILESKPVSHLNDKVICEYLNLLGKTFKDFFEMERSVKADEQTTVEIDIQRIEQELKAIKTAIREAISEICPQVWPTFLEKLSKLSQAPSINQVSIGSGATNVTIKI